MKTPAENAKILRRVAKQSDDLGCHSAAKHLRECAFQLDVFELVGLKLEGQFPEIVRKAMQLVHSGVTSDCLTEADGLLDTQPGTTPSDFNISRN